MKFPYDKDDLKAVFEAIQDGNLSVSRAIDMVLDEPESIRLFAADWYDSDVAPTDNQ